MDMTEGLVSIKQFIKKYGYVAIVLLAGLILMIWPEKSSDLPEPQEITSNSIPALQDELGMILSLVQGAGKVKVLLTQETGEQIFYQTDENTTQDSARKDTVLIEDSNREETGLIRKIRSPIYRGAVVLCQGADNASVRLSVMEAVKSVTGLTSDRITILKMK